MKQGFGYRSEQRLRKDNQDSYGAFEFPGYTVVIVCDGMGGHAGGAQASSLAVRTVHDVLSEADGDDLRTALLRGVEAANRAIYEAARKNYRLMGMGTTCVAALIEGTTVHVAHVGDSRAYLLRNRELRLLTRDHTMVNLFVDAELLSPDDAATHPEAHVLSRSLGVERQVEVEVSDPFELREGDRLFLTSDGVHGAIGDIGLAAVDWSNPITGCDEIAEAVDAAEGDDNATIVAFAAGFEGAGAPPSTPPDPQAVAEAARESEPEASVQAIGATGFDVGETDDVAPIEDLEDLPSDIVPRVTPKTRSQEDIAAQVRSSNRRAVVALGGLSVVGLLVAVGLFSGGGAPRTAPQTPEPTPAAQAQPDAAPLPPETVPLPPATPDDRPTPGIDDGMADAGADEALSDGASEPEAVPDDGEGAAVAPPEPDDAALPEADDDALSEADDDALSEADGAALPETEASDAAPGAAAPSEAPDVATPDPAPEADAVPSSADDDGVAAVAPPPETDGPAPQAKDPAPEADVAPDEPRWSPPPPCLDCTSSLALPSSMMYLPPEDEPEVAVAFYAPKVPAPPKRLPHAASRYDHSAPRGPAQASAIQQARSQQCREAFDTVEQALSSSIDYAVLYRTVWYCFNDADQGPLARAQAASPDDYLDLSEHFRGPLAAVPGEGEEDEALPVWQQPAEGGIEYRLERFLDSEGPQGFSTISLDLLGEPTVADHLGVDLLLEATAAAAASREDRPSEALVDSWARRVFVLTRALESPLGELVETHRPDLHATIDALVFEATGGDAGRLAVAAGLPNTFVPATVATAQAVASGMPVPDGLAFREDRAGDDGTRAPIPRRDARAAAPDRTASARPSSGRPSGTPSTRPSSRTDPDGPTASASRPAPPPSTAAHDDATVYDGQEAPAPGEPLKIKVYKLKKRPVESDADGD